MNKATAGMEIEEFPEYVPPAPPKPTFTPSPTPTPTPTPEDKVMVPYGTGQQITDVMAALSGAGLTPVVVEVENEAPQGTVLSVQREGQEVDRGTDIRVEVSTGPAEEETVQVPGGLVGGDENNARNQIQRAGLNPVIQEQASNDFEEGTVMQVNPSEGTEVPPGSDVQVIVSSGPLIPTGEPTPDGPGGGNGNGNG